jgi:hypothetical protein
MKNKKETQIINNYTSMDKTNRTHVAGDGTTGPLNWKFRDGTLTVGGIGKMPDYFDDVHSGRDFPPPWRHSFGKNITAVIVEKGVTSVGNRAFYGCTNLVSAVIPEGVTSIGSGAFAGCESLTSIIVPEGATG